MKGVCFERIAKTGRNILDTKHLTNCKEINMGYFSRLFSEDFVDRSYPLADIQIAWRYEELTERYQTLLDEGAPWHGEDAFGYDDYRYAPVECFVTLSDVSRAIEIAKVVLDNGIELIEASDEERDTLDQIPLFDIVCFPLLSLEKSY